MSDVKRKRLKFNRDVMRSIGRFIPEGSKGDPQTLYLSRKLLSVYLLCRVNSVHYHYSVVDRHFKGYGLLSHGIYSFLNKILEIRFYWPEEREAWLNNQQNFSSRRQWEK